MFPLRYLGVLMVALGSVGVLSAQPAKPVRVGVLGLDNYQAVAYAQLFNNPKAPDNLAGVRVVAALKLSGALGLLKSCA